MQFSWNENPINFIKVNREQHDSSNWDFPSCRCCMGKCESYGYEKWRNIKLFLHDDKWKYLLVLFFALDWWRKLYERGGISHCIGESIYRANKGLLIGIVAHARQDVVKETRFSFGVIIVMSFNLYLYCHTIKFM